MKINALSIDGKEKEYEVILTYYNEEYDKNYIVYTDNNYDNDELRIFISYYSPNGVETVVKNIEDNEEYNKIKVEINKILLTIKNENDKL